MKKPIFIILLLSSSLNLMAQDVWSIAWLKPSPVHIGGKVMTVGNEFEDNERIEIQWISQDQVMKVVEKESLRCIVLSAKAFPQKKGGKLREYINVSRQLSTRRLEYRESVSRGEGIHYLGYEQDGKLKSLIPYEGMFMDELPKEIWLCYTNVNTGDKRVETRDFRALVDDLIITDELVRREMAGMDGDQEDYLSLMSQFLRAEFRDIPLTEEEIKTFITLKY